MYIRHQIATSPSRQEVLLFPQPYRKTLVSVRAQLTLQLWSNSYQSNTSAPCPLRLALISFSFKTEQVGYKFGFTKLPSVFLPKYSNDISAH